MISFFVNEEYVQTDEPKGRVLLDFLRHDLSLKSVKEGCREGDCGACTVLIGTLSESGVSFAPAASCLMPIGQLHGKQVVTLEGLNGDGLSPVQQAIVDEGATQCGFCTPGIVMALTGFLFNSPGLSGADAVSAVEGNICRCTGYASIRRACQRLADQLNPSSLSMENRIACLIRSQLIPAWFGGVEKQLQGLSDHPPDKNMDDAVIVAGGTDLFVQKADTLVETPLKFLGDDPALKQIEINHDRIKIGAGVTIEAMKQNRALCDAVPGLAEALKLVSSTLIRNQATAAGNVVNASPIGDVTLMLLALDAQLIITGPSGSRRVQLDVFYTGYKQFDLLAEEYITAIQFPMPGKGSRFHFEKVSRREHLDIASVNSAIRISVSNCLIDEARLSAGGVAPVPLYLKKTSNWLQGKKISAETVNGCIEIMLQEIAPMDDVRGSADYKKRLLRRLIMAHFVTCFPEQDWEGLV